MTSVDLSRYSSSGFDRGRHALVEALWIFLQAVFVSSSLPGSLHRKLLLRIFGAQIGQGVVIKPRVRVKFPWRLLVYDHVWIGEGVWIDNLSQVYIHSHCCLSQDAYLCTGNHDWSSSSFDLVTRPIVIGSGAWIAARASVGPGVTVGEGSILTLNSSAYVSLEPYGIYSGVPAAKIATRRVH